MNQKSRFQYPILATAALALCAQANAAGFQLNEYSSSGLGRAFSGEGAVIDNATAGSRNPASMTMFDRPAFSGGLIYIDPDVNLEGSSPVTGQSTRARNIAPAEWIPNLHFILPLSSRWALGASAVTNYGLATEFNDSYAAGPLGGKTDLLTSNLNLSAAYRLDEHFSFGLGVNAVYAKAKIIRTAGDLASVPIGAGGLNGLVDGPSSEVAHLKGDAWGYGLNAGLLYEINDRHRLGFSWRSKVDIDFNGDYRNDIPRAAGGTGGDWVPGELTLNLPEMWEFSAWHRVAPSWAVHYSLAYTSWSHFQQLKASGSNGQTLFEKHEGFRDAWRMALGATWFYNDDWTFRSGIAFDDSPVPADNRSISIPDQDRFWLSAGATYAINKNASLDVGLSWMYGKKVNISEPVRDGSQTYYRFTSKGSAMLYGMNVNYTF
ncbi:long-chain fatty acid transporter FadL [Affinibrenneria salicis]|uniref:Long-chain fatty acid transport protein n=1 Tax=Affinibrenneria salicis TaxID=2590031 RepID=A0A5J5FUJ6_9GAMM|nr:long-chain fatty acid transporter FadL [Affinibrenneria salicis]KAA8996947.1 long-chain fatty acid transporter FadL [Affinibrenneria salicis]